jgi:hypothetical protein
MTTTEHLEKIKSKCRANLARAAKRTPGKWREMEDMNGKQYTGKFVEQAEDVNYVIAEIIGHQAGEQHDAAFIAACAGDAEAGWKATIAAIEWALVLLDCTNELDAGEHRMINTILAAWPEDSL